MFQPSVLTFRRLRAGLGALLLAALGSASHAGVSLSWDLSQWNYTLTPDQTLVLQATVYNEASATEHLLGSRFVGAFGEGIEFAYDFLAPEVPLAQQFAAMDLAPGESMSFVFGRLVPIGGQVALGDYQGGGLSLAFRDASGAEVSWTPERSLQISVVAGESPGQTLPEPATLALAGTCLAVLAWQRRRRAQGGVEQCLPAGADPLGAA